MVLVSSFGEDAAISAVKQAHQAGPKVLAVRVAAVEQMRLQVIIIIAERANRW